MLNSFVLYKDSFDKLIIQVQAKTYKKESGRVFVCTAAAGTKKKLFRQVIGRASIYKEV
ncbi:MAG: hypothetical protein IPP79_03480 [Chitinophagaceae bacterium]|nr:hypothetical protein [Chitinophagaceae bacterium]